MANTLNIANTLMMAARGRNGDLRHDDVLSCSIYVVDKARLGKLVTR